MKRILAIDDSQFNLLVVQKTLEREYAVTTKLNSKEGIDYALKNHVDLILLDIEMPELDGISTLKILKKHHRTARIPIIFLTSVSDHDIERACLDLGARDFITKPFNEPVMRQRIKIVLELEELKADLEKQVRAKGEQLEKLTAQIITVFSNSRDCITGLWSRLYIEQRVNTVIDEFMFEGALAVIDVDDFRVLNDALGYRQGNECLKQIGEGIREAIGEEDLAGRSSGNEFLIYFYDVKNKEEMEEKVVSVLRHIEQRLSEKKFHGLTFSVGISTRLEAGNSFEALYFAAEKALHYVKKHGKNNLRAYSQKER